MEKKDTVLSEAMPHFDLVTMVATLTGKSVLIIGDIMLDTYLFGDAERISPEAPVPVVCVKEEEHHVGGAGNVARNVAALGGKATLIAGVGHDIHGEQLNMLLSNDGIVSALVCLERPTTVKTRILARRQQMLRLDYEKTTSYSNKEQQCVLDACVKHIAEHDVVVLSDYAKGLLSPSFMHGLTEIVRAEKRSIRILADPKPVNMACYHGLTLLTPNARETGDCVGFEIKNTADALAAGRELLQRLQTTHLLTTLGAEGMALFLSADEIWHIPTVAQQVFDVTGAGDTVIATLALALAAQQDLLPACVLANYAAGLVVAQVGAATVSPIQLIQSLKQLAMPCITRWV